MHKTVALVVAVAAIFISTAQAAPFKVETVLSPKQAMRLNFEDGSKHFVVFVRREGKAQGSGPLAGAAVTEFGMHDIIPGVGGDPRGYLVFTGAGGDKAYLKFRVRAVFIKDAAGKPRLRDHGYWEVAGGTGMFKESRGVGTIKITAVSKTDRKFTLEGEIGD
jgi:hypothetical protein